MAVNENYREINVAREEADPDSVLNFYRKAIHLRKSLSCVRNGVYREYRHWSGRLYLYSMKDKRQTILVVCSFSEKELPFKAPAGFLLADGEKILGNYRNSDAETLNPYECRVYLWK